MRWSTTMPGLERDRFDPFFDHMLAIDDSTGEIVGVYRLLPGERAVELGQFYSEDEYDLTVLKNSGRKLLELGRSCLCIPTIGGVRRCITCGTVWLPMSRNAGSRFCLVSPVSRHGCSGHAGATAVDAAPQPPGPAGFAGSGATRDVFQPMDLVDAPDLDRRAAMVQVPA